MSLHIRLSIRSLIEKMPLFQMESTLGAAKYAHIMDIFNNYRTNDEYKTFSSSLFEIFQDDPQFYNLKGMILLIKPMHRQFFETDLGNFIESRQ